MPTHVIYPKVSLEATTGTVSRWLVSEGDIVTAGQILFEIENDKAAVEVEAPAAGIIRQLAAVDVEIEIGAPVAVIDAVADAQQAAIKPEMQARRQTPEPSMPQESEQVSRKVTPAISPPDPNPTPLARRIARDHQVNIEGLPGTGPRGRVQKKDVLAHLEALGLKAQFSFIGIENNISNAIRPDTSPLHHVWLRKGEGMPVVLIHGFSGDLNNWRGLFAGRVFDAPVLALDLPCHGGSPLDVPADMEALAQNIEEHIQQVTDGRLVLAGHSFGGAVASRIAARGNLDVRGLCLFSPAGLGPEINQAFTDGILRARESESLRPWLNELVHNSTVISEPFVRAVVEQRLNQQLTGAMRAFASRFMPDGTQGHSILADLARLTIPTRVIFGRNDRILPYARTVDIPGHIALHSVLNCGHMPHLEYPELSLRILSEMRANLS